MSSGNELALWSAIRFSSYFERPHCCLVMDKSDIDLIYGHINIHHFQTLFYAPTSQLYGHTAVVTLAEMAASQARASIKLGHKYHNLFHLQLQLDVGNGDMCRHILSSSTLETHCPLQGLTQTSAASKVWNIRTQFCSVMLTRSCHNSAMLC